jgi:phage tail sheath protein FI
MAVQTNFTSPGVYITETEVVPHIVTPATTSLTAVIGLFEKGPTDEALLVTSWAQFEQEFGGFGGPDSLAPYAVFQFFQNGGSGAWIVRLTDPGDPGDPTATPPVPATPGAAAASIAIADVSNGSLTVSAQSAGAWGNALSVQLAPPANPLAPATAFDLVVLQGTAPLETISGLDGNDIAGAAAQINATSGYITATTTQTKSQTGPIKLTTEPTAGTPATSSSAAVAPTPAPYQLATGSDGTWTPKLFVDQVLAELGFSLTPGPVPTPRLDKIAPQVFNLMVIPDATGLAQIDLNLLVGTAQGFCAARQAFLILDTPAPNAQQSPSWGDATRPVVGPLGESLTSLETLVAPAPNGKWAPEMLVHANENVAAYYPWIEITDPSTLEAKLVPPSGTMAGVYATTDATRGVWKAPAGTAAGLRNVNALADITLNDTLGGALNDAGINVLRSFATYGNVVWGARTCAANAGPTLFKYPSVRRLADFIEQSLQQSLKWAVFEPNGPTLWAALKLEATAFMSGLYGAGAFAGTSASAAFQVACDATTTSPDDQLNGIVNLNVGFAAIEPAEFVVVNVTLNAATGN